MREENEETPTRPDQTAATPKQQDLVYSETLSLLVKHNSAQLAIIAKGN